MQVRVLVLDARIATAAEMEAAVASLTHLDVSLLVNNVGGNPVQDPAIRALRTYSCADVDAVINQNARFMTRLTALMLPVLARRREGAKEGEERSLVLSLASGGMYGLPWLQLYGATKAFNWALTVGLAREFEAERGLRHVDALVVVPNEVRSQGNSRGVPKNAPLWDEFGRNIVLKAEKALKLGWREMRPDWKHDVQLALLTRIPEKARTQGLTASARAKKNAWNEYWLKNQ